MQFKANQTKAKLKKLFKNIDEGMNEVLTSLGKTGKIRDDLFF